MRLFLTTSTLKASEESIEIKKTIECDYCIVQDLSYYLTFKTFSSQNTFAGRVEV